MVNNPPHYGEGTYQVINVIEAWELNYRLGNVVKYVARAHRKGHQLEDLKKAAWYLQREIEALEGKKEFPIDIEKAKAAKERCAQGSRKSTYISVYTDTTNKDQWAFSAYAIQAHHDWTIETLAGLVATGSKEWACGTFGLNVGLDPALGGSRANVIQTNGYQTVDWLLKNFPPDTYAYYLVKAGL